MEENRNRILVIQENIEKLDILISENAKLINLTETNYQQYLFEYKRNLNELIGERQILQTRRANQEAMLRGEGD